MEYGPEMPVSTQDIVSSLLTFICLKSTIETPEQCVKFVQS